MNYQEEVIKIDSFLSYNNFYGLELFTPNSELYLINDLELSDITADSISDTLLLGNLHFNWRDQNETETSITLDTTKSYLLGNSKPFLSQSATLTLVKQPPISFSILVWLWLIGVILYGLAYFYHRTKHKSKYIKWLSKRRRYKGEVSNLKSLFLPDQILEIDGLWEWLPFATRLTYRKTNSSPVFDLNLTINQTSSNWGYFSPGYATKQRVATYIALVDRHAFNDHQANYSLAYINQLKQWNISVLLGFFNTDPRYIFLPGEDKEIELSLLKKDFPTSHVIIFSNLEGVFSPFTGGLEPWAKDIATVWPSTSVFTPESVKSHHSKFQLLRKVGLEVHPLSPKGVWDYLNQKEVTSNDHYSNFVPLELSDHQLVSIFSPSEEKLGKLISSLRIFLGPHGFYWLAACARFPEIHLELTLELGKELQREDGQGSLMQHDLFLRIMQLPWFREGFLPKWLRNRLLSEVTGLQRSAINNSLAVIVARGLGLEDGLKKLAVNLPKNVLEDIKAKVVTILIRNQPPESPLHDEIFLSAFKDRASLSIQNIRENGIREALKEKIGNILQHLSLKNLFIGLVEVAGYFVLFVFSVGIIPILILLTDRFTYDPNWEIKARLNQKTNQEQEEDILKQKEIFGHSSKLYVLFFTEMWERFSYYGMRALLVIFLVTIAFGDQDGSGAWTRGDALALYGIYTSLIYFTPLIGGVIADRFLGYRRSMIWGALIMILGYASMALVTSTFFYLGLLLLVIGNGLFKPSISSLVGRLYETEINKKEGAYSLFYMGINAGAFLGISLCGYYGGEWGFSYGFGLSAIIMSIGLVQFWSASGIFGKIGQPPTGIPTRTPKTDQSTEIISKKEQSEFEFDIPSDYREGNSNRSITWPLIGIGIAAVIYFLEDFFIGPQPNFLQTIQQVMSPLVVGGVVGFVGWILSDKSLTKIERDRVWVIIIFGFFIVFFWWAFELAGGSMTIFASDYIDRSLRGPEVDIFRITNVVTSVLPMAVLTYVVVKFFNITFKGFITSNIALVLVFSIVWILEIIMLYEQFSTDNLEVQASWFAILNSLFIICFAPLFSKLWEKDISWLNSGPVKFALGLILLGLGFATLAFGAKSIPSGARAASLSMFWLIAAYLLHTLGELCISPIALSYVSKLAPARLIGVMFGVFFVAHFIASFLSVFTGSQIDTIAEKFGISEFFYISAAIPIAGAIAILFLSGRLKKMMHGIE
jgi:POT family proton-dependent oligopeptide transporter